MSKLKALWECVECGFEQVKWAGSCSQCQKWNTFVEKKKLEVDKIRYAPQKKESKPVLIQDVSLSPLFRDTLCWKELNRIFGSGIVKGSLVLIAGDPGIGKSTLMLQLCQQFVSKKKVLYVCAEESVEQTLLRAKRLNIHQDQLFLFNETTFEAIQNEVEQIKPDILVIDSIQVLYKQQIPSSPGSTLQVREITTSCMHLAKSMQMTTFLVGHVTKSGEIAGPKMLEHLVDVVLDFEGDPHRGLRLLRSSKNRFGPTEDMALFQMKEAGLEEVVNPSELFLEERMNKAAGSCIVSAMQGIRPFLIEVQALVTDSAYATATRKCTGLDQNRFALLLAVLEKKMGYHLQRCDIFVSLAGGLKIKEPAIDLALLLAIASSFTNQAINSHSVSIGEVGLAGEIRAVSHIESRVKEAIHMGFQKCLLPKRNIKGISKKLTSKIQLVGVSFVEEAISELIK